jgi:hypothetical protein
MPVLGTSNNTPDESIGAFRSYVRWRFLKGDGSFTPLNTRFFHLFLTVFFLHIVSVNNHNAYFKIF